MSFGEIPLTASRVFVSLIRPGAARPSPALRLRSTTVPLAHRTYLESIIVNSRNSRARHLLVTYYKSHPGETRMGTACIEANWSMV